MLTKTPVAPHAFTIDDFLSRDECETYIELTENLGFSDAPITTISGEVIAKGVRNNERAMLDDCERSDDMWQGAEPYCPEFVDFHKAIGLNERFRFYRYDAGQVFRWHRDGPYRRDNGEKSRLTFLVYLNDGFEGGETIFESTEVHPKAGMALVFAHGLLHEGGEVFSGRKYVLRTDVMYSAEEVDLND